MSSSSSTSEMIETIRNRFLAHSSVHSTLYHPADVERVKNDDWQIERFLQHKQMNLEKAYRALLETMQWRMSKVRINDQCWTNFPEEFYRSAVFYIGGNDRNGGSVIYVRGAVFGKIKSWSEMTHIFMAFLVEEIDRNPDLCRKGLTVVINARKVSMENIDMDTLKFALNLFREHYPGLLSMMLVYKLPKLLDSIYRVIKSWLNENETNKLALVTGKNITNYIDLTQLPPDMGGTAPVNCRVPKGIKSTAEIAKQLNLKEGKAEKLTKHYQKHYGLEQTQPNEDEEMDEEVLEE